MKNPFTITLALGLAACAGAAELTPTDAHPNPALDDTLAVSLGKSVMTSDGTARITFREKLADSRCGIGMVCIWAGDVGVALTVERAGSPLDGQVHSAIEPRRFNAGDLEISLVDLSPYPGDKSWNKPPLASVRVTRKHTSPR